jgi:hypothetical protein
MSASGNAVGVRNLVPFQRGFDPRRQQGPRLSKAELEFRAELEAKHIPQASALLRKVLADAMEGDMKAAELFFKVCGLLKKPTDDAAIAETARVIVGEMIAAVKARREEP